jgi:16S rRNA G966 N2-methylase RsmD
LTDFDDEKQELLERIQTLKSELAMHKDRLRFGLVWEQRPEQVEQDLDSKIPVLRRVPELDVFQTEEQGFHSLIEGDNLHALAALQATHQGKIDVIYIDPPYNTGDSDWKYNNKFVNEEDGYFHSQWLSFMERRIKLAKNLLDEDGVLIVTIDEHEVHRLALLLEQHFRPESIQMVTIVINGAGSSRGYFSRVEEYAFFVFCGDATPNPLEDDYLSPTRGAIPSVPWDSLVRTGPGSTREDRPKMFYPIHVDKESGRIVEVGDSLEIDAAKEPTSHILNATVVYPIATDGSDARWRVGPETFRYLVGEGFARARVSGDKISISYLKRKQLQDIENGTIAIRSLDMITGVAELEYTRPPLREVKTVWNRPGHNAGANGTQLVKKILGNRSFPFPKSLTAVEDTLRTVVQQDSVILDFFAGSGTTLHAVARLNAEDGGRRRCILVTNNENDICREVTQPRVKRVLSGDWAAGQQEPLPGNLMFFQMDFIERKHSLDQLRVEVANNVASLVSIREACPIREEIQEGVFLLTDSLKSVVVVSTPDRNDEQLQEEISKQVGHGGIKRAYLFTWNDREIEEEVASLWQGWEVEPLPADMLAALRSTLPQKSQGLLMPEETK